MKLKDLIPELIAYNDEFHKNPNETTMKLKDLLFEAQFPFLKKFVSTRPELENAKETEVFEVYANELSEAIWKKYKTKKFAGGWDLDMDPHAGGILLYHDDYSSDDPMQVIYKKFKGKGVYYISIDYIGVTPFWEGHKGIPCEAYVSGYDEDGRLNVQDTIDADIYPKWTGDITKDLKLWEKGALDGLNKLIKQLPTRYP